MTSRHLSNLSAPAGGWSLDELVGVANQLLPGFLPHVEDRPGSAGKVKEEVNARLVRHYAGLGLLDDNTREGKEARYAFRHLLQLLLVRRLLTEGYPAAVIAKLIAGKTDAELRALLQGGASVSATPANPALEFLSRVRRRAGLSAAEPAPSAASLTPASPASPPVAPASSGSWTRLELLPGLEVHVREGSFRLPSSPHEREALARRFLDALQTHSRSTSSAHHRHTRRPSNQP